MLKANRLRQAVNAERRRHDDGRKYVVGGAVLAAMRDDPVLHSQIVALLAAKVTRPEDRKRVADLLGEAPQAASANGHRAASQPPGAAWPSTT
jgi:hypothetical protein